MAEQKAKPVSPRTAKGDDLVRLVGIEAERAKKGTQQIIEMLTEDEKDGGPNPLDQIAEILERISDTLNGFEMRLSEIESTLGRMRPTLFREGEAPASTRSQPN
ncbi:hypothetical protein VY88_06325 [Azospirillum thiophilum]|uniref:Uncharacterized protein n=1 Tax=Azospirillum thiophilum TaxID=528244 RepID=A0AAC8VWR9_9PROT|nr:hypothetical protein AL072_06385 [Azospirillum thiophilum]KJR65733.1 hypothetical protein VY88_06325 [Azospirillum thiophilum]